MLKIIDARETKSFNHIKYTRRRQLEILRSVLDCLFVGLLKT